MEYFHKLKIRCRTMEAIDGPDERAGGLLTVHATFDAYGDVAAVAAGVGLSETQLAALDDSIKRGLADAGDGHMKPAEAVFQRLAKKYSVDARK
jgi:hypothetical protein